MKRRLRTRGTRRWGVAMVVVAATIAVVAGGIAAYRHDRAMHAALRDLQAANLADSVFRSDSAAQVLVRYFDHPWHASNTRVLAHYLLGRAHADMGEAPQAIDDYQTAVERADTTDKDCDFRLLRNVYGQMAEVFRRQHLYEGELEANQYYGLYSQKIGDTYEYARSYLFIAEVNYATGDTTAAQDAIQAAKRIYLQHGMKAEAAQIYAVPIHEAIGQGRYATAKDMMDIYERASGLFDQEGNIQHGREIYYYDKGMYYLSRQHRDSAEYLFRKLMVYPANAIDAYRGMLKLYQGLDATDSICKYASAYEDALEEYLNETQTEAVAQAVHLYNYERNRKEAELQRKKAITSRWLLATICGIVIIGSAIAYLFYKKKRRAAVRALQELTLAYALAKNEQHKLREEISCLQMAGIHPENTDRLIGERNRRISLLEAQITAYQDRYGDMDVEEDEIGMLNTDIVQRLKNICQAQASKDDGKNTIRHARAATLQEWEELIEQVRSHLKRFYLIITVQYKLTDTEYKVCILSRLRFRKQDMATLLGTKKQSVSNARNSVARKLFHLDSAIALDEQLFEL